jgi:long-chain fatty acid transport protein
MVLSRALGCAFLTALLVATILGVGQVHAAGIISYELSTHNVGLAAAGWAARTDDASILFRNPAGMSRLDHSQFLGGVQLLYGDLGFKLDEKTTVSGNAGGNPVGLFPAGGLFYVHNVSPDLKCGLGVLSYFGLGQEFDQGWVGRYYAEEAFLAGLTLMPSLSYKANDWLSVGAGLNAMLGMFDQKVAINNLGEMSDGRLEIGDNTWGFGANVGVLLEQSEETRFGLSYLSPVSLGFRDKPEFSGLRPILEEALRQEGLLDAELDLGMEVPQCVMASFYHELAEQWAIMGNVGWQNWKRFGKVDVTVKTDTTTTQLTDDRDYKDTWHVALGAQFRATPDWELSAGLAYDGSPVDDQDRTIDFAVGETYRLGVGAQRWVGDSIRLGGAYELGWSGDLPMDQYLGTGVYRVSGESSKTALHFFALSLEWNFGS